MSPAREAVLPHRRSLESQCSIGGLFVNCLILLFSLVAGRSSGQTDFSDISGYVYSMAIQTDGRIVAGGEFDFPGGTNLCRINSDGTVDATFNVTVDGSVMAVALQADGRILIGGYFTTVNG